MADMLDEADQWLADTLADAAGRKVLYQRGDDEISLTASRGSPVAQVLDESGTVLQVERQDWLIAAADLVLGTTTLTPAPADRIVDGSDTYAVVNEGGEACYRRSDPAGNTLRIHTKRIS